MKHTGKNLNSQFELFNNLYGNFEIHVYPYGDGVEIKAWVGSITVKIGQVQTVI